MARVFTLIIFIFCESLFVFSPAAKAQVEIRPLDINAIILQEISTMPIGGGYSTRSYNSFASSFQPSPADGLMIHPSQPSFCSGATYTIFLKTLVQLQKDSVISLPPQTWYNLLVRSQADGVGIWGRWNANGPGTACLFHELSLGYNFIDFNKAMPGDFAKFCWTLEVGQKEHGHSVIYLGREQKNGQEMVSFWSSNIPGGYGKKSVPRTHIKLAIFSRLTTPKNISNPLLNKNDYLASLLQNRSSFKEALQECGILKYPIRSIPDTIKKPLRNMTLPVTPTRKPSG